jgi:CDP-diacylglycerol--glycerol-3-phosphate 3-phosphatidyltransferase
MAALWRFLGSRLAHNTRVEDGKLLPRFGLGNSISIFRGFELILLTGFLFIPAPDGWTAWLPALLYTSADILDILDGYFARVRAEVTQLGGELEQLMDGAGLLIATLLAVHYGTLSWWFLPFGAARYLFLAGIWIRERRALRVYPLAESRSRRPIAGMTMGFMTVMLWPIVKPPASTLAGAIFLIPFGASFLRDWLVVSGTIDPCSQRYLQIRGTLESVLLRYGPVAMRTLLGLLLAWDVWLIFQNPAAGVAAFRMAGFPIPGVLVPLFAIIELAAIPLLVLGIAGRFTAFVLLFPIGLTTIQLGLTALRSSLLVTDLLTLMLGTGRYSLWEPSRAIFGRRLGSPK